MKKIKILSERKEQGEFKARDFYYEAGIEETGDGMITLFLEDYFRNKNLKVFLSEEEEGTITTKELELQSNKDYYLFRLEIKEHPMYWPEVDHYRDTTGDEVIEYTFYDSSEEFNLEIYNEEGDLEKTTKIKF